MALLRRIKIGLYFRLVDGNITVLFLSQSVKGRRVRGVELESGIQFHKVNKTLPLTQGSIVQFVILFF